MLTIWPQYTHVIKAKSGQNYAHNNIFNKLKPNRHFLRSQSHSLSSAFPVLDLIMVVENVLAEGNSTIEHITKGNANDNSSDIRIKKRIYIAK